MKMNRHRRSSSTADTPAKPASSRQKMRAWRRVCYTGGRLRIALCEALGMKPICMRQLARSKSDADGPMKRRFNHPYPLATDVATLSST